MPREYKILLSIAVAAVLIGVLLFKFAGSPATPKPLANRADAPTLGNPQAKVVVTEFADFQCPACRLARDYSKQLLAKYPADVKIVFRHFPLAGHPLAQVSAQAAEAAGAQGKFWEMHDLLYENQPEWGDLAKNLNPNQAIALFAGYARQLGLDEAKFTAAVSANAGSAAINQDMSDAAAAGVDSTPQYFVNQTMIPSPSMADITKAIDQALAK